MDYQETPELIQKRLRKLQNKRMEMKFMVLKIKHEKREANPEAAKTSEYEQYHDAAGTPTVAKRGWSLSPTALRHARVT